eukprot:305072-Amorphochlora_amoeboformis.AAC.1
MNIYTCIHISNPPNIHCPQHPCPRFSLRISGIPANEDGKSFTLELDTDTCRGIGDIDLEPRRRKLEDCRSAG